MHCYTHSEQAAVAVCVNCGAAICSKCIQKTATHKNACSEPCAIASNASDSAISAIASRVKRSSKANAWVYWSLGIVFSVLGGISMQFGDLFLVIYLLLAGIVFIGAGFWYNNIAKRNS